MLSKKFLFTLVGILIAVFAVCNMNFGTPVVEGFWNGIQLSTKMIPGAKLANGRTTAIGGNYLNPATMGSNKFVSTPAYQAMLSPRFSNLNYGADIKYNMPDRSNMAVPCDPLTFGDMSQESYMMNKRENFTPVGGPPTRQGPSRENYGGCANCGSGSCSGGCPPSCGKGAYGLGHRVAGGYELTPDYHTPGNWKQIHDDLEPIGINMGSEVPLGAMTTTNGAGEPEQVVMFNNLMYATRPVGKNYGGSDYIRGDLAITPCMSGWFSVYPDIATDINPGAMQVLTGQGESNNATLALLTSASGRATFGGVDLNESLPKYNANMALQSITNLSSNLTDINVTAFP